MNGATAATATMISGGETIVFNAPEEAKPKKQLVYPLKVLFEDEYLALVHKPAGILVSGNGFVTLAHALPQNLQPSAEKDATVPQPVHRLDYATTGILMVGKTSSSIRALNKMFEEKKLVKTYYAVAIGEMNSEGSILSEVDDKNARSDFSVIHSVSSPRFGQLNLVKLLPKTGRRHQLRVHLSSIGKPILGDKDYGIEGLILKGKGMYLHAYSLEFMHPFTGENMRLEDPLPKKFKKLFSEVM